VPGFSQTQLYIILFYLILMMTYFGHWTIFSPSLQNLE